MRGVSLFWLPFERRRLRCRVARLRLLPQIFSPPLDRTGRVSYNRSMRVRIPHGCPTGAMPDAAIDAYIIDGQHRFIAIQCKTGMGKTQAFIGALLAERAEIRRELQAIETTNLFKRVSDPFVPDPSTIKDILLAQKRKAMREHIARLR